MTRTRTLALVPLAAALCATAVTSPTAASADPRYPSTIALPTGSMPEGISAGPRDTFFAGARTDGAVYVGNAKNGTLRTLVPGREGEIAVGLLHDAATSRLWVAGGTTGDVTAYDARSGRVLFTANVPGNRFLNDVTVTPEAVYLTDSRSTALVVVPTPGGTLPDDGTFSLLQTTIPSGTGFGPNGIRDLPTGELLVVSRGDLFRVDPANGGAVRLTEQGRQLTAGDGLELAPDGRTLYVVNGFGGDEAVVVRLDAGYSSATTTGALTDEELDRPTTGALLAGALYVVNGRFGTLQTRPDAPVYVTRLPLAGHPGTKRTR